MTLGAAFPFGRNRVKSVGRLGAVDILTVSILAAHERVMSFHLFVPLQFLSSVFLSFIVNVLPSHG